MTETAIQSEIIVTTNSKPIIEGLKLKFSKTLYLPYFEFHQYIIRTLKNGSIWNMIDDLDEYDLVIIDNIEDLENKTKTQSTMRSVLANISNSTKFVFVASREPNINLI